MSPADERRRLVQAAQRREPFRSEEWFGESGVRTSLYPAEEPARRGWAFAAVSAALVVAALGTCWLLASSDSVAQWIQGSPDHAGTTEVTSAPAEPAKPVEATNVNGVPMTVQPAVVPTAPPVLEESPKVAPAAPPPVTPAAPPQATLAPTPPAPAIPEKPVAALPPAPPAAVHHEPAGPTTIHVVETPEPDPE